MTDADRLREAADRIDAFIARMKLSGKTAIADQDRATAALLRAVADVAVRPDETAEECYVWDRANDLADTILGLDGRGDD